MTAMMRFTILGSGSSGGVPRIGGRWGECDPQEPRNQRTRSSFLVEKFKGDNVTRLLIDTSPDLRAQLLKAGVGVLDGVLYTHGHADHTHGIDDLRAVYFESGKRIPTYFDEETASEMRVKFAYCFEQPEDSNYVPILEPHVIEPLTTVEIAGPGGTIEVQTFPQHHGNRHSLGLKFGGLVYATDVHAFPDCSRPFLQGLDVLILDALRFTPHPCHFSVEQALSVIQEVRPERALLTHLHVDLDYQTLKRELPAPVEPAYDGLVIEL